MAEMPWDIGFGISCAEGKLPWRATQIKVFLLGTE
jgi:hypothetical protein